MSGVRHDRHTSILNTVHDLGILIICFYRPFILVSHKTFRYNLCTQINEYFMWIIHTLDMERILIRRSRLYVSTVLLLYENRQNIVEEYNIFH